MHRLCNTCAQKSAFLHISPPATRTTTRFSFPLIFTFMHRLCNRREAARLCGLLYRGEDAQRDRNEYGIQRTFVRILHKTSYFNVVKRCVTKISGGACARSRVQVNRRDPKVYESLPRNSLHLIAQFIRQFRVPHVSTQLNEVSTPQYPCPLRP